MAIFERKHVPQTSPNLLATTYLNISVKTIFSKSIDSFARFGLGVSIRSSDDRHDYEIYQALAWYGILHSCPSDAFRATTVKLVGRVECIMAMHRFRRVKLDSSCTCLSPDVLVKRLFSISPFLAARTYFFFHSACYEATVRGILIAKDESERMVCSSPRQSVDSSVSHRLATARFIDNL